MPGSIRQAAPGRSRSRPTPEPSLLTVAPAVRRERSELQCSLIALAVKASLAVLAGVSLVQLACTYQERMVRQGELAAVLNLEQARLARLRERFDHLFSSDGEQRLIREQSQWIAPNRRRVVWQAAAPPANTRPISP